MSGFSIRIELDGCYAQHNVFPFMFSPLYCVYNDFPVDNQTQAKLLGEGLWLVLYL